MSTKRGRIGPKHWPAATFAGYAAFPRAPLIQKRTTTPMAHTAESHEWPGNLRELENAISSAATTAEFIDVSDLRPARPEATPQAGTLRERMAPCPARGSAPRSHLARPRSLSRQSRA